MRCFRFLVFSDEKTFSCSDGVPVLGIWRITARSTEEMLESRRFQKASSEHQIFFRFGSPHWSTSVSVISDHLGTHFPNHRPWVLPKTQRIKDSNPSKIYENILNISQTFITWNGLTWVQTSRVALPEMLLKETPTLASIMPLATTNHDIESLAHGEYSWIMLNHVEPNHTESYWIMNLSLINISEPTRRTTMS